MGVCGWGGGSVAAEDDAPKPTLGEEALAALTDARARARSIARSRVARLRLGAQTALDALDAEALGAYRRMQTAINARVEAEGTAVGALLAIARDAIESQRDLPFDLRIDAPDQYRFPFLAALAADTDVTLDEGVRWLPLPVPPPPPVVDNVDPDGVALSGAQLAGFDAMLQAAARAGGRGSGAKGAITCRRLAACMARAAVHDTALPLRWQQLELDAFDTVRACMPCFLLCFGRAARILCHETHLLPHHLPHPHSLRVTLSRAVLARPTLQTCARSSAQQPVLRRFWQRFAASTRLILSSRRQRASCRGSGASRRARRRCKPSVKNSPRRTSMANPKNEVTISSSNS